ncbi:MAG: leucyl aminopeptidase [Candidatus Dormibacteria bacterium]
MLAKATETAATEVRADALVLPYFQSVPLGSALAGVDRALGGLLSRMHDQDEATGAFPKRTLVTTMGRIPAARVVLLGLGRARDLDGYRLRNALQFAVRDTRSVCSHLAVLIDPAMVAQLADRDPLQGDPVAVARAVAEGVGLGNYHLGQLKSAEDAGAVEELEVLGLGSGSAVEAALADGMAMAEVTNRARFLQWQPGNQMTPTELAAEAERVAQANQLELEVLDRPDMERLGMGALLAVARGSHEPPKLVALRYRPRERATSDKVLGLVGKGITFDTGGISLKPNAGMVAMKADMSGAAAVIEAMALVAQRQAPIQVLAVAAITENMPGGGAVKPGDVVQAMNGKSVEINNTDAEGRLVLADALGFAADRGATHLVDVSTLTGGAVVALGQAVTAAMGTSPELLNQLRRAGALAGERIWELPLFPEYEVALTCEIADIHNTSGTPGASAINGGIFLRQFTGELPWVHLDIAGTAYHMEALWKPVVPHGPSGVMTRTLAHLPFQMV